MDLERSKLKIVRFQKIKADQENFNFSNYFRNAISGLEQRIHIMDSICMTDLDQATNYQKKHKNFENAYFEEFMKIVQQQNNDQY